MPMPSYKITYKDLAIGEIFVWSTIAYDSLEAIHKLKILHPLRRLDVISVEKIKW